MTVFQFRKGVREQTSTLIALAGPSGCGKTFSALRLATGLAGPGGKIAVIDTEAGRALHYADQFNFDHGDLHPPFRPQAYLDAILAAERAGYAVVVIDSMSHEYEGEGGILEWADELAASIKSPGNWKAPKTAHKKMVNRLLQLRCHLIFCLRAEEKIKIEKHPDTGKTVVVPLGWMPICEKRFMYEMTTSFTLTADKPGKPQYSLPHKCQDQHRAIFPEGQPIDEKAGQRLAAWAKGGAPKQTPEPAAHPAGESKPGVNDLPPPASSPNVAGGYRKRIGEAERGEMKAIAENVETDPDLSSDDKAALLALARQRYSELGRAAA